MSYPYVPFGLIFLTLVLKYTYFMRYISNMVSIKHDDSIEAMVPDHLYLTIEFNIV